MAILPQKDNQSINQAVKEYVLKKGTELLTDVQNRKNGIKGKTGNFTFAGYDNLRRFFDGDQWDYVPAEGSKMRVYNYVATTVLNYTAFMTNETPEFDVPPAEITDPIEIDRAEKKEHILKEILKDNKFSIQYEDACLGGSLLGDTFIVGPFWNEIEERIEINYVKNPESIRPIFSTNDYSKIIGYIRDHYMAKETAEEVYSKQLKAHPEIVLTEQPVADLVNTAEGNQGQQHMVHIQEFWNDQYMALYINTSELDFQIHNWGFVPLTYIKNIPHPKKWYGISDAENILDPQVEYNEQNSKEADIVEGEAHPTIFGKNLQPVNIQGGAMQLVDLGDDAEIIPDPRRGQPQDVAKIAEKRRRDIFDQSGLNEIVFGGASIREATGRALSVLMQSVNNRIKGRQERWRVGLKEMSANIFRLLEIYIPESKTLINEVYDVDIFFPATLLRNVTDEINKYSRKLQSRYTTMKNLGVPSPKDEEQLMEKETLTDAAIQAQAQAIMQQAIAKAQAAQSGDATLDEGDNQAGDQPAAVAGVSEKSPISPEGAIEQANQQTSGVPTVKGEE